MPKEEHVSYETDGQTLKIAFRPNLKTILRIGYGIQGMLILSIAVTLLVIGVGLCGETLIGVVILIALIIFFILIANAYLQKNIWY